MTLYPETPPGAQRRRGSSSIIVAVIAVCLCVSSILQLSIATEMMGHAQRLLQRSAADPPLAIKYVFPLWTRGARLPWELLLVAIYALSSVWFLRTDRDRAVQRLVLLWVLVSTIFFAGVWLAMLPYRVCCV